MGLDCMKSAYITSIGKIQEILALLALLALIVLAGGGAASRHVNSFKSTSSSAPQRIYYVKGVGEGGGAVSRHTPVHYNSDQV